MDNIYEVLPYLKGLGLETPGGIKIDGSFSFFKVPVILVSTHVKGKKYLKTSFGATVKTLGGKPLPEFIYKLSQCIIDPFQTEGARRANL
eukprot:snap_masked-scaffold_24-processed-gene-0.30-mRNA-1 protein AED:1.00 eAED:1.00 QI:0/-1/0/0/-1/1/1/0/89